MECFSGFLFQFFGRKFEENTGNGQLKENVIRKSGDFDLFIFHK